MDMETIFEVVLKDMNEPATGGNWTTTQLYNIANRIQSKVVRGTPGMLQSKWTQTLSTDDQELTIPTNFLQIENVHFDKEKLYQTNMKDLDIQSTYGAIEDQWRDTSGKPKYYYLRSELLGLYPKVSAAYNGKSLDIYGTIKPTTLASSSDVPFDNFTKYYDWHDMIIEGMLWKMKIADENGMFADHKEEFYRAWAELKFFVKDNADELPSMPLVMGTAISTPTKSDPLVG